MAYFEWNTSYDIGVDIIDSQHRRIADYVNGLDEAIKSDDKAAVFDLMELLKDYTFDHFAFEEQLMERAGYPLLDAHLVVHQRFRAKVNDFEYALRSGDDPIGVARKIRNELTRWLIQHIQHEDQNYAAVVRKALKKESSWVSAALTRIFGTETRV
ncbi:bacteriohemerythrin [Oceanobacter mangrovi]|uniref:bacteriohemerythrin n=1 Tax=Oceanobacter mangrovi TaxID=2862510 RepID=UPI001C8E4C7E|nr:bacteriohemerythrin [Oceanobacter mangrovi]